jgi:hypothetical protein
MLAAPDLRFFEFAKRLRLALGTAAPSATPPMTSALISGRQTDEGAAGRSSLAGGADRPGRHVVPGGCGTLWRQGVERHPLVCKAAPDGFGRARITGLRSASGPAEAHAAMYGGPPDVAKTLWWRSLTG